MFIRDALSSLPTRPVLFLAPLVVVLVLSWYYRDLYNRCSQIRADRDNLSEAMLAASPGVRLRLDELTAFTWDQVRIITGYRPQSRGSECPFDWNWSAGERDALIAAGHLTALVFARDGAIVRYVELNGGRIELPRLKVGLEPAEAIFRVRERGVTDALRLELADRKTSRAPATSPIDPVRGAGG